MIEEATTHLSVLTLSLHIPMAQSLKEKRMVLRRIKDRVHNRFNVSIAELDNKDKWQTATLGFAMLSSDGKHIDRCFQNILNLIDRVHDCEITDQCIDHF